MARFMRSYGQSDLRPPVVVGAGIAWHGPGVYLTSPTFIADRSRRRDVDARLSPPAVVTPAATQIFFGPKVNLNVQLPELRRGRVTRRSPDYELKPPIFGGPIFFGPKVNLNVQLPEMRRGRATRRSPDYELKSPVVVGAILARPVVVALAIKLSPRPSRKTRSTFVYPIVVFGTEAWGYVAIQYVRRPQAFTKSKLFAPAIGTEVSTGIFYFRSYLTRKLARKPVARYELRQPVVIGAGLVNPGLRIKLTYSRRGAPKSALRPPVVVYLAVETSGPETPAARIRPPRTIARLSPPRVVNVELGIFYGTKPELAYSRRGTPKSRLQPPTVVFPFFARATDVTFAPQRRGTAKPNLGPPVVVFLAVEIYGPVVVLTRIKPPPTIARLSPPADITEATEFPVERVHLSYSRRGVAKSVLHSPVVIGASLVNPGLRIKLTFGKRGTPKSHLSAPAVVGAGIAFYGPQIWLTYSRRGTAKSRLLPPVVVFLAVEIYGPEVHLTRIKPPPTISRLSPPADITESGEFPVERVHLAYSRRLVAKSSLKPPAVVAPVVSYGPAIELAPSFRGTPKSKLAPPSVVAQPPAFLASDFLQINLTYSRRGRPVYFLKTPTVVFPFFARRTDISLAPQRRGVSQSFLRAPAVIGASLVNPGLRIKLTFGKRGVPKSTLFAPAVIGASLVNPGLRIKLAAGFRGVAKSVLTPPVVSAVGVISYGPQVTLVRIRPAKTLSGLGKAFTFADSVFGGTLISLAPQRRPITKSALRPPTVVAPVLFFGPATELAPSFRGQPTSFLKPPAAVNQPPAYTQVIPPTLTYSRRGRPIYSLGPPTVVFPFFARKTDVTFASQRRGQPVFFLRPAVVVRLAVEIYGPEIALARIKPQPTITALRPPTDISDAQDIGTLEAHLAPSTRGKPTSFLFPPAVVASEPFRGLVVSLAPSSRGQAFQFQIPPIIGEVGSTGPEIHFTRITPPPVLSLLNPPAVIGGGIAFHGPGVYLTRIKPAKVIHAVLKAHVVEAVFIPPHGDVCGFDISESFICFIELPGARVVGRDESTSNIENTTASSDTISGGDRSTGTVIGGDQEAN